MFKAEPCGVSRSRESVQAYCTRFSSVYNALSSDLKPPQDSALNKFPEGFDLEMSYQLRERDPTTLEEMQKGALSMEFNLMEKRARMKIEKRVSFREENAPSNSNSKMEKMMEEMMKKMSILERAQASQNQNAPQNRNQNQNHNFRRNQPPNRPREDDQQIIPPFHQNYLSEVEEIF